MLPALRRDVRKRRVQGIGDKKLRMLRMWQKVHGFDGHDLRFEKDTHQRMDRVSAPPVRIPFAEDVGVGQQKRGNDRPILAFQGLRRAPRNPGRGRPVRKGLDRREALRRPEIREGIRQKEIQCERRSHEGLPILCGLRDRRGAQLLRRHRKKQAGRQGHAQGIRKANRRMLDLGHDGEKGHNAVIDALALKSEVHTSAETRGMKDEDNPLDEINDLHDKMEKFMRAHSGYDRASLQDWMNLFWLLTNGPRDKMDKVKWFLEMAFSKKIRIKYRDRFGKIEK